jgi:hypothetical protein
MTHDAKLPKQRQSYPSGLARAAEGLIRKAKNATPKRASRRAK